MNCNNPLHNSYGEEYTDEEIADIYVKYQMIINAEIKLLL